MDFINTELQNEKNLTELEMAALNKNLREKVTEVEDKLKDESIERDEADKNIERKLQEDINTLNSTIGNEKNTREASEQV